MGDALARPSLQDYLDYRTFVRDFVAWEKARDGSFSFRVFALRCGIAASSASFICRVIAGQRMLTPELCVKFARGMGLPARESQYFHALVRFNQAKTMEAKNHFFLELAKHRNSRAKVLGEDQFQFFGHWLNQVLWAFFGAERNLKNPAAIARRIRPAVSARQVEEAIALMLRLKLIKKLANGYMPIDT